MSSPVDTSVKYFHSGMVGVPQMSNAAGGMLGVLTACLVNGFGLQTATSIVVASNVATITTPSVTPAEVGTVVLVGGATPAALNGEQKITAVLGNTCSFATTGITDQTATGTITFKMAPAGWSEVAGTNVSSYRAPSGLRHYLRVDDTGVFAKVRGYETMSDVDTGTGPFPTIAQYGGSGIWWSRGKNSTNRNWMILVNGTFLHISCAPDDSYPNSYLAYGFGDLIPTLTGDLYSSFLSGLSYDQSNVPFGYAYDLLSYHTYGVATSTGFSPRESTGLGTAVLSGKSFACSIGQGGFQSGAKTEGSGGLRFPNPSNTGLYITPLLIINSIPGVNFRGTVPGFYGIPMNIGLGYYAARDTVMGNASVSNKKFKVCSAYATSDGSSPYLYDITGPW